LLIVTRAKRINATGPQKPKLLPSQPSPVISCLDRRHQDRIPLVCHRLSLPSHAAFDLSGRRVALFSKARITLTPSSVTLLFAPACQVAASWTSLPRRSSSGGARRCGNARRDRTPDDLGHRCARPLGFSFQGANQAQWKPERSPVHMSLDAYSYTFCCTDSCTLRLRLGWRRMDQRGLGVAHLG